MLAQFKFYLDFKFTRSGMLPSVRDVTSVGFRRSSFAFLSRWEVISDREVGLRVAYIDMRRPYASLEESSIGLMRQTSVSFTMPFFYPSLCQVDMLFQSDSLHHLFVSEESPSV